MRRAPLAVAVVTALAFGCATVRAPAGAFGDRLDSLSGSVADPQVELWVESGDPVSADELARARGEAQEALRAALAGLELAPDALGAAEPLLVTRARAVARTASRRSDQRAATVGIAVGIVVVVVAVVAIAILSKDAPKTSRAPGRVAASAARAAPSRVRLAAPARAVAPRLAPAPRTYPRAPAPWPSRERAPYGSPAPGVSVGVDLVWTWPPPPYVLAPDPDDAGYVEAGPLEGGAPEAAAPGSATAVELALPPPPDLPLETRGFFSGDETAVALDLVDQRTGQLLWSRVVRGEVDPRDAAALRKLVAGALAREPWTRSGRAGTPAG